MRALDRALTDGQQHAGAWPSKLNKHLPRLYTYMYYCTATVNMRALDRVLTDGQHAGLAAF